MIGALLLGIGVALVVALNQSFRGAVPEFGGLVADLAFVRRSLAGHELPLWNPYELAGYPFVAQPHAALFDPLQGLLAVCAVGFGAAKPWMLELKAFVVLAIAATGIAAFLRSQNVPRWAQAYAVVTLGLGAWVEGLLPTPGLWPLAWLGWCLLALERVVRVPSMRTGAVFGLMLALTHNAGDPGSALAVAAIVGLHGVGLLGRSGLRPRVAGRPVGSGWAWALGSAVAVVVIGVAGQALAWWPIPSEGWASGELLAPGDVRGVFGPSNHEAARLRYLGVLAVPGWVLTCRRPKGPGLVFVVGGALGFLVALRTGTMPGLTVMAVSLTLGAAFGLAELEWCRGPARTWPVVLALAASTFGGLYGSDALSGGARIVLASATACLLLAAFAGPPWRRLGLWLLPIFAAVDLTIASDARIHADQHKAHARGRTLAAATSPEGVFRVANFDWADARFGSRHGVRDLMGGPVRDDRISRVIESARHSATLLGALNVDVVAFQRAGGAVAFGTTRVGGTQGLHRVERPWPLAYWTHDVRVEKDFSAVLVALMEVGLQPAARFEAPGPELALSPNDGPHAPVAPVLERHAHNTLRFRVDAPQDGVFVVAERHAPYWHTRIDGEPAPLLRVNGIFRGVPLSRGSHTVDMVFDPPGVVPLWWLWWSFLGGWGAWRVWARLRVT